MTPQHLVAVLVIVPLRISANELRVEQHLEAADGLRGYGSGVARRSPMTLPWRMDGATAQVPRAVASRCAPSTYSVPHQMLGQQLWVLVHGQVASQVRCNSVDVGSFWWAG